VLLRLVLHTHILIEVRLVVLIVLINLILMIFIVYEIVVFKAFSISNHIFNDYYSLIVILDYIIELIIW